MIILIASTTLTTQITGYPRLKLKVRWQSMKFQFIIRVAMQEISRLEDLEGLHMVELIPNLQGATFVRHKNI
jgi:hypothetical protein